MSASSLYQLWEELGPKDANTEQEFGVWRQKSWRSFLVLHKLTDTVLCSMVAMQFGRVWFQKLPLWGFFLNLTIWSVTTLTSFLSMLAIRNYASLQVQKCFAMLAQISMFLTIIVFNWVLVEYKPHDPVMQFSVQLMCMGINLLVGQKDAIPHTLMLSVEFIFYIFIRSQVDMADSASTGFTFVTFLAIPTLLSFIQEAYQRRIFMEQYYAHVIPSREQLWQLMPYGEQIRKITQLPSKGKEFQYLLVLGGLLLYVSMNEWGRIQLQEKKSPGLSFFVVVFCWCVFFELVHKVATEPQPRCTCVQRGKNGVKKRSSFSSYGSGESSGSLDVNELLRRQLSEKMEDYQKFDEKLKGCSSGFEVVNCQEKFQYCSDFDACGKFKDNCDLFKQYPFDSKKVDEVQSFSKLDTSHQSEFQQCHSNEQNTCCVEQFNCCSMFNESSISQKFLEEPEIQVDTGDAQKLLPQMTETVDAQNLLQQMTDTGDAQKLLPQMTVEELKENAAKMKMSLSYLQEKMNSIGLNLHIMKSNNLQNQIDNGSGDDEESEGEEEEFNFSQWGSQESS